MINPAAHHRGFTLIELMIVITVAAILLGIGVPSYRSMVLNNRRVAVVNDLVSAFHFARMEAYSRNRQVRVCIREAQNPPTDCNAGGTWADGWLVFVDDNGNVDTGEPTDRNGSVDSDEEILLVHPPVEAEVTMSSTLSSFQFTRRGQPTTGTVNVCANGEQRDIKIEASGQPRLRAVDPLIC